MKFRKIFAFDLDGTLTESKSPIDEPTIKALKKIVDSSRIVCIISGGGWPQFQKQLISFIDDNKILSYIHCFPTSGASYYRFVNNQWVREYHNKLSDEEKYDIISALDTALAIASYSEENTYGDIIEDRDTQITFSALGQKAPLHLKKQWDPDGVKRKEIIEILQPMLPQFDVRFGGTTSIDISKKNQNKLMAINKIKAIFGVNNDDIIYFGDQIKPNGNDYIVYENGILSIPVINHIDCVSKIYQWLNITS